VDVAFRIPGTTEPEIRVRGSAFGRFHVLVDGTPAKRIHRRTLSFEIPQPDGTIKELRLTGQWRGLKAVVDGVEIPLERQISPIEMGLTFLPLALILGGVVGGLVGLGGAAINARLIRTTWPAVAKAIATLGVAAGCLAIYLAVAVAVSPVETLATGACLDGVRLGSTVDLRDARTADCARTHDVEVIGVLRYGHEGSYPGENALLAYAEQPCRDAFISYIGVPYETSSLDMILIRPTEITWAKGDRQINCAVGTSDGTKLIGSVKGSAR
jgi:hypothetical protein